MKRPLAIIAVASAALLSLSSCYLLFPKPPIEDDIVGTWVVTNSQGFHMNDSVLTFEDDGTFTWTGVQLSEIGAEPAHDYVDLVGEWTIKEPPTPEQAWSVGLGFDPEIGVGGARLDFNTEVGEGLTWWKDYDLPEFLLFQRP